MILSRRGFLGAAGGAALAGMARAGEGGAATLHAKPGEARLAPPDRPATPIWGYDGQVPGPTIRAPQGRRVVRRFLNGLPQPSTVHWHGLRIDNAMDGVPGLTQPAVPPGGAFLYDFLPPDAGTYWYHSHHRAWEQMARGLYGALVVEEREPPAVDRDETLLVDDWRLTADAAIDERFATLHDRAHAGRLGNWATVNGDGAWRRRVRRRERLRLRLVNTANARVFSLAVEGLDGWVAALDGQPLPTPRPAGRIALAPGQRADLIVDVTAEEGAEALLLSRERDGGYALATFAVRGAARPARLSAPGPLPPNPTPALGRLDHARRAILRMEGGAMGRLRNAVLDGRVTSLREMASRGKAWALNGRAGMPDEPLLAARKGETVRLSMINDTAWPHAMHLHGHHARRIADDGTTGPLRDTLLVQRGETAEIAFVADNPGDWLLHCHMLEHEVGGMATWIRVA